MRLKLALSVELGRKPKEHLWVKKSTRIAARIVLKD